MIFFLYAMNDEERVEGDDDVESSSSDDKTEHKEGDVEIMGLVYGLELPRSARVQGNSLVSESVFVVTFLKPPELTNEDNVVPSTRVSGETTSISDSPEAIIFSYPKFT